MELPYRFTTYVHGDRSCEIKWEMIEDELGLNEKDKLASDIAYCDYEVKLTWEIDENQNVKLVEVNDNPLVDKDEYEAFKRDKKIGQIID